MSIRATLRTLSIATAGLCACAASADVFLDTSGPNNLDLVADTSFIQVGLTPGYSSATGVVANNVVGKLFDSLYSWSDSIVNLNDVTFFGYDLQAHDTSTINYLGGSNDTLSLVTFDDAVINISGGSIGFLGTGGGTGNGGSATISGGTVTQNVSCFQGGPINITGGNFGTPDYGLPFSFISFVPAGIAFSGTNVVAQYIGIDTGNGFDGNVWLLSGTLDNGGNLAGLYMVDVGIFDPTIIVNYSGVAIAGSDHPPVANAGVDFSVNEGGSVSLDGTLSSDPDGDALTYAWTQLPGGPSVALAGASTATPSFTAPTVAYGGETLSFELTVTANGVTATDTVSVNVVNVNHVPVADAGPDFSIAEGSPATLQGEHSFDIDGDPIAYTWVQVSGTPTVTLTGANTANPTFIAPFVGGGGAQLTFELRVDDGFPPDAPAAGYQLSSNVDTVVVNITHTNNPPIANAGCDRIVCEHSTVSLNGSASSDPDGDALSFSWTQVSGPAVTLADANTATPSFVAPWVNCGGADLTFRLTVNDGYGGSASDTILVRVKNVNDPPRVDHAYASICRLCEGRQRGDHDDDDDGNYGNGRNKQSLCNHQKGRDCNDNTIWPPDHSMVNICIMGVIDRNSNATITITSVRQDEPTNGLGDGDTAIDAIIRPNGTLLVRAERAGNGNGRVYHIHFTAADAEGSASGMVTVKVPKSKNSNAVDGGELYDSTR